MAMQARAPQQHDGGIAERRLRPIYDWLDNGNNKKALQEAEKVLKKSPTLQAARALKALALFRLGKGIDAHAVLETLAAEKPSDDSTLQAMTITYRESQQLGKVCALYEAAVQVEPTNEELYSHLFMSYVRTGDPKSQQRAAMALYKFAPKNPYYFWAVMSIVLQAKTSHDSKQRGILLALAQRMVENFITEKKMEAEQEARLYLMILELQEKWEDILKFMESPLYTQLIPGSMPQATIPCLKKLGLWKRINIICKELLWENQDRWDYYMPYFDSVFQLIKDRKNNEQCGNKNEENITDERDNGNDNKIENLNDQTEKITLDEEKIDDTAEKCHEFLCQIMENVAGRRLRGPYLARLELWKRLSKEGDPTAVLGSGVGLCLEYLRAFAHKSCAVPDLRQYIDMLPQKEREENCREFLTCLGFDENSEPETPDDIQRHISCVTVWRLTAPPMKYHHNLALAISLRKNYVRCLYKGLVTATPTEFCSADGYGVLAAHHYFYAAREQRYSGPVIEALCFLELVHQHSPANYHIKLLMVTFYHLLGNALAADTIYQRLEVKHIQLVSLGWVHTARLTPACAPTRALQLLADTRAAHHHNSKDSVEHLTYAYKYGTFEKLVELYAWSARLESCAWCCVAARERALVALLAGPPAPLHAPGPLPAQPTDNRDITAILNFEPPQCQDKDLKFRTFARDLGYLRLKDGLLSCVALCIESADNKPYESKRQQYVELKGCIEAFRIAMDKCKELYNEREKISISAPFPSRIIALVNSPVAYRELYYTCLSTTAEVSAGQHAAAHTYCAAAIAAIAHARDTHKMEVRDLQDGDPYWTMRDVLECTSNYLEFIGVVTFLLGICNELVTPTAGTSKKPKKKAAQSPDELKTSELLNELSNAVQESISQLEEFFANLTPYQLTPTCSVEQSTEHLKEKFVSPVQQKLKNGQRDMINDITNVLKKKSKYLKSLVL